MNLFKQSLRVLLCMAFITGVAYPLIFTQLVQILMPEKANGSLFKVAPDNSVIGSRLIGQKFEQDKYFWPRPSAVDFNPLPSGGSNLGPTSAKLKQDVETRAKLLMQKHGTEKMSDIPPGLIFASGSGLDPDIATNNAFYQLERVAKARKMDNDEGRQKLESLIHAAKVQKTLNLFGRDCVNVLILNNSLDELERKSSEKAESQ